ncbi:phosphate ABC transporter permease subunit PstC [Dehalococcoidia bacterium]|nr:phosphate ABC transporter permease subunit PstC [Dehalococcoidia bacterium]
MVPLARRRVSRSVEERLIPLCLLLIALISVFTTVAIVVSLSTEAIGFFREVSLGQFFGGTRWAPTFVPQAFGIWPLISGTLLVTAIAAMLALPVGLGAAIFLSEYAPETLRRVLKPMLEVLAGVPTVVYGFFALTFVTPVIIRNIPGPFADSNIFNALSAGLVVGVMIIPMVASLSEDAMVAVPQSLRQAAYALGATRFEVARRVIVPAAFSGIVASFILATSRAIGETMIVTLAAGATPKLTANPLESIQTMTAYIVQIGLGETPFGTIEYKTIFAVGFVLFCITLAMNIFGHWLVRRLRENY